MIIIIIIIFKFWEKNEVHVNFKRNVKSSSQNKTTWKRSPRCRVVRFPPSSLEYLTQRRLLPFSIAAQLSLWSLNVHPRGYRCSCIGKNVIFCQKMTRFISLSPMLQNWFNYIGSRLHRQLSIFPDFSLSFIILV